jgi:hypothetical protein
MPENSKSSDPDRGPEPILASSDTECLVSWRRPDGTIVSTGPLQKDRAEKVAEAYRRISSGQHYWVAPLPPEVKTAHDGRVRRRRYSKTGH